MLANTYHLGMRPVSVYCFWFCTYLGSVWATFIAFDRVVKYWRKLADYTNSWDGNGIYWPTLEAFKWFLCSIWPRSTSMAWTLNRRTITRNACWRRNTRWKSKTRLAPTSWCNWMMWWKQPPLDRESRRQCIGRWIVYETEWIWFHCIVIHSIELFDGWTDAWKHIHVTTNKVSSRSFKAGWIWICEKDVPTNYWSEAYVAMPSADWGECNRVQVMTFQSFSIASSEWFQRWRK